MKRPTAPPPDTISVYVLARLLADERTQRLLPLADYLAEYPGSEEVVARQYLKVVDGTATGAERTAEPAPAPAQAPGGQIGPYVLEAELGRGGQGVVWRAHDTRLGRPIALKVVRVSPASGGASPRFQREARAASRLSHPGICAVHDVGSAGDVAWIAMELVPGATLQEHLRERAGAPLEREQLDAALAWIERCARALHAAHGEGITHRDVKPGNVILRPTGEAVLCDFGIALDEEDGTPLTITGAALGTPAYTSPEQLDGQPVDARADVWSLGATAYELVTGRPPFQGATRARLVEAITRDEPPPASERCPAASRDLDVVLATALTKEVERRYASALAFAEDLARVRAGAPVLARPIGTLGRLGRWVRRNRAVAASLVLAFLSLAIGLGVAAWFLRETRTALARNESLLSEVTELADLSLANDLIAEEPELWPATSALAPRIKRWLDLATSLESRAEQHRASLAAVRERTRLSAPLREQAELAAPTTNQWMERQLTAIGARIDEIRALKPALEERYELASTLHDVTVGDVARDWEAVARRLADDPRFRDRDGRPVQIEPQLGLLPLGPDPDSGLEEFGHPQTGRPPERDPETGELVITPESSVVLVLVPGGRTRVGAGSATADGTEPQVDPQALPHEGPSHEVWLDPFFIAKHEFTIAQWVRHTGDDPTLWGSSRWAHPELPELQPVEQVSFLAAMDVLAELGLTLPTDAQWEHAARGGTTTVWYTGNEPETLIEHVNLADHWTRDHGGGPDGWMYEEWLEDFERAPAPVGSFRANPFGLFDVAGNVCELTRSRYADYRELAPLDGDGDTESTNDLRDVRGSSFSKSAWFSRSAFREGVPATIAVGDIGFRVARPLER